MGLLRILSAICVFCSHSRSLGTFRWLGGGLAVELFFVISGFYMQLVLSERYTREKLGERWAFQFYKARYFRLLPIYLAAGVGWAKRSVPTSPLSLAKPNLNSAAINRVGTARRAFAHP
ncbi:MAG: acyltransferase family protein, partial [Xanthobacteraceae bacterium]